MERVVNFKNKRKILEASIANFRSSAEEVSNLIKEGISFTNVRAAIKRLEEMAQNLIKIRMTYAPLAQESMTLMLKDSRLGLGSGH